MIVALHARSAIQPNVRLVFDNKLGVDLLILMNLKEDLDQITTANLIHRGFEPPASMDGMTRYATLERHVERSIHPIAYKILVSRELSSNPLLGSEKSAVDEIVDRLESGKSVAPYQSTRMGKVEYRDSMLAFWGIHHLHLNSVTTASSNGFVKRADHLLFIRFAGDVAHLIDILPHTKPNDQDVFLDIGLVEIVDRNWPHLHHQLNSVRGATYSESELSSMRKTNTNHMLKVNGRAIMPRSGVMTSGYSFTSVRDYDNLSIQLEAVEADLRREHFKYFGHSKHWLAHVKLMHLTADRFDLMEKISGQKFQVLRDRDLLLGKASLIKNEVNNLKN